MDKDSIRDFLEKRHKEMSGDVYLPELHKEKKPEPEPEPKPVLKETKKSGKFRKIILWIIIFLILIFAVFATRMVYIKWNVLNTGKTENILERVAVLTDLPIGEEPKIVTVTNSEQLKNQTFFKDAKVGDKVLIFKESKKAVLYRPSTNKIISIAPLN